MKHVGFVFCMSVAVLGACSEAEVETKNLGTEEFKGQSYTVYSTTTTASFDSLSGAEYTVEINGHRYPCGTTRTECERRARQIIDPTYLPEVVLPSQIIRPGGDGGEGGGGYGGGGYGGGS